MTFKNEAELLKFLIPKCVNAVNDVKEEVHGKFSQKLGEYYGEFAPKEYIRTGALHGSLSFSGANSTGNGAEAEVYFDIPSYQNGLMLLQHTPEHGMYGWATWSGEQVLDTAMNGSHGGYVEGTAIWGESMSELGGGGGIKAKLVAALAAQGLPIG